MSNMLSWLATNPPALSAGRKLTRLLLETATLRRRCAESATSECGTSIPPTTNEYYYRTRTRGIVRNGCVHCRRWTRYGCCHLGSRQSIRPMTPPTAAEWEKHMEVHCCCCLGIINPGEPRDEIFWLGSWSIAHPDCAEQHRKLMEEDV